MDSDSLHLTPGTLDEARLERSAAGGLSDGPNNSTTSPNDLTTDLKLVFIGDGPLRKRLEQRVKRTGLGESVEFAGCLPHEEVAEWMRKASLLCLTSRSEGMPNVVLEALACGLPVVASDVGAVKQMLVDCNACRAVSLGADFVRDFALAIEEICFATIDRRALTQSHHSRTWETMAAEIVELMK